MKNESQLHAQEKIIRARQTLLCLMSQSLSYCARVAGGGSHRGLDVPMHVVHCGGGKKGKGGVKPPKQTNISKLEAGCTKGEHVSRVGVLGGKGSHRGGDGILPRLHLLV